MILEIDRSDAGIDWVTASEVRTKAIKGAGFSVLEAFYRENKRGGEEGRVRFGGYAGLSDQQGLKVGKRDRDNQEDFLLVCSGPRSHGATLKLANLGGISFTRLDLQVTFRTGKEVDLARALREETLAKRASGKQVHGRAMTYYSSDTGDTLYIGKRTSKSRMVRIYDKGGEMGGEKGVLWRIEVEYHRSLARPVIDAMAGAGFSADAVSSMVATEMASLGCILQGVSGVALPKPEVPEDVWHKKVLWLKRCVRPVLSQLAGNGMLDEALGALGIANYLEKDDIDAK